MKTRTLLLLALACGVAIMAAGAVLLVQLSRQESASEPVPLGETTRVGDMRVAVADSAERDGVLTVDVTIGGVDDPDGAAAFRLIAAGRAATRVDGAGDDCGATTVADQRCVVRFDVSAADGESRVLFYERGDEQVRWALR